MPTQTPTPFEKKLKSVLLLLAVLLPTVAMLCLQQAGQDGTLGWLARVGTVAAILGTAITIYLREENAKGMSQEKPEEKPPESN